MQLPHCDSRVLHAPGVCIYCDKHQEWQELRKAWGINFTGRYDPSLLTCPSEANRSLETINKWRGNVAITQEMEGEYFLKFKEDLAKIMSEMELNTISAEQAREELMRLITLE